MILWSRLGKASASDHGAQIEAFHQKWKFFKERRRLFLKKSPLITRATPVFCMGSCFALEVKNELKSRGYLVHPWNAGLEVARPTEGAFRSSGLELVHFNTFTMRQEFEKAFGLWRQDEEDFWLVVRKSGERTIRFFQDPYRRTVYSETLDGVRRITTALDGVIRRGIFESDVYILTLGLTEVWEKNNDGRIACTEPGSSGGGGKEEVSFRRTGFAENCANLKRIVELVRERFPSRHLVLTVSPVPLSRTYADADVFVATAEAKSILRTVVSEISREYPQVHYFPSYEICSLFEKYRIQPVFEEDGRHVTRRTVSSIMDAFLETYAVPG